MIRSFSCNIYRNSKSIYNFQRYFSSKPKDQSPPTPTPITNSFIDREKRNKEILNETKHSIKHQQYQSINRLKNIQRNINKKKEEIVNIPKLLNDKSDPHQTIDTSPSDSNNTNSFKSKVQLMRDFIQDSLYNSEYGYFTTKEVIISPNVQVKPLNSFKNHQEYNNYLHDLYKTLEHAWLTPVELFKPFYSYSIIRYILEKYKKLNSGKVLKIYEIGAGSGTNAISILNYLRDNHEDVYKTMNYTIIEISRLLADKQLSRIKEIHPNVHISINNTSIFNWTHQKEDDDCFIILTEVIDNLPHDKITKTDGGALFESVVHSQIFNTKKGYENVIVPRQSQTTGFHREEWRKLSDPIINEYLWAERMWRGEKPKKNKLLQPVYNLMAMWNNFIKGDEIRYIPTVCFKLFQIFSIYFPKHHLVLADFDFIPSIVPGENAPTVQEKVPILPDITNDQLVVSLDDDEKILYESRDSDDVIVPLGSSDIFFPYNFKDLKDMYCFVNRNRKDFQMDHVQTLKHGEFVKRYSRTEDLKQTETKSKYNPILEDYSNMSFLIS
ncbi:hypothetical protein DLAC_09402 [Tieghemostelium lacteum]|uniref:Protein arginine methyltransferase NDUFAF7 n=1 Tax=Tieghemostelium lacteum TaxID=361077 RepID=A0A151ZA09_TIELA|nr:hypothetical protein DLAC_09402 [Tieghemostelium lacteum]|eukprot:KYQ90763.1 hypothetical protein DLAC_09402 [Tieghemostelium lacteum]